MMIRPIAKDPDGIGFGDNFRIGRPAVPADGRVIPGPGSGIGRRGWRSILLVGNGVWLGGPAISRISRVAALAQWENIARDRSKRYRRGRVYTIEI